MPTNRTRRRRNRHVEVHPAVIAYLKAKPPPDDHDSEVALLKARVFREEGFREAWQICGDQILAEWVAEFPGTRPSSWWNWSAPRDIREGAPYFYQGDMPILRQRLGGTGSLKSDHLAHAPSHVCGIPASWIDAWEVQYYGSKLRGAVPIDPNDPPVFESQAAYLKRHGLFLPGEEKRLKAADFDPEKVTAE